MIRIKKLFYLLSFVFILSACNKDDGPNVIEINLFVAQNMNTYYLWNSELPNLDPYKQKNTKDYFKSLLYQPVDRWSFITDDADELENYFAGVRKEMGYSLKLYRYGNSNQVIGFIEYVEPGGPADKAGLKRGDMLIKINGVNITTDNYTDLFYADELNIGLGVFNSVDELVDLSPSVNVYAEVIQVNPILEDKIFEEGGMKIGYLAYTGFINEYDDQLTDVFSNFKAEGISDLILDLRYNPGGAVSTARLLASLICPGTCQGKLFLRTAYNDILEDYIISENPTNYDEIFETSFDTIPANLNLGRVYVLTTEGTASASEMVIYSLSPYMDVVQIGEQTHGKYYGSITIKDEEGSHNWAIQPIIMRAENVDNSINYEVGLIPDIEVEDDYSYELGDREDVLTSIAIGEITGNTVSVSSLKSSRKSNFKKFHESYKKQNPLKYEMYIDKGY